MDWVSYAFIAMVSVGISMSLYKMPSFKGYSSLHSTFLVNFFSLGFSLVVFSIFAKNESLAVVSYYGLLWGALFAITMALQKILLHRIETNTLLPVTSSLGNVLTVLIGVMLLAEKVSLLQAVATLIIIFSVFLYSQKKGGLVLDTQSVSLGLGIIVASTLSKVVQKFGAVNDTIFHFSVYQYIGASLFALLLIYIFERKTVLSIFRVGHVWKISMVCGFFMTIAGFAFLKALSAGPLSGVYPITAGYIFVTALLGVFLYNEKLTKYKVILLAMTFTGVILMRLG